MQQLKKPKILIIEDNERWRNVFVICLRRISRVLTAGTVRKATELIRRHPDAVLLAVDRNLVSDNDGVEVVRYAKERGFSGPIVAISGMSNRPLVRERATHEVDKLGSVEFLKHLIPTLR